MPLPKARPPRWPSSATSCGKRELVATAAAATTAASAAAHAERLRLRTDIDTRTATLATSEAEDREAAAAQSAAQQAGADADTALSEATADLEAAEQRLDSLRRVVTQLAERDEADRLAVRLTKIAALQQDREQVSAELSATVITEAVAHRIEAAAAALDRVGRSTRVRLRGHRVHRVCRHRVGHGRSADHPDGRTELVGGGDRANRGHRSGCPDRSVHSGRHRAGRTR